ncbi:MAG: hypothetical protein K0Q43_5579 [Ramlibacter sp.]|nr:hypothetical protein [Ramlibacter sp.]
MPTPAEIAVLRTLALVGPATAGKTSLVEALLWTIPRWCISSIGACRCT